MIEITWSNLKSVLEKCLSPDEKRHLDRIRWRICPECKGSFLSSQALTYGLGYDFYYRAWEHVQGVHLFQLGILKRPRISGKGYEVFRDARPWCRSSYFDQYIVPSRFLVADPLLEDLLRYREDFFRLIEGELDKRLGLKPWVFLPFEEFLKAFEERELKLFVQLAKLS